MALRLSERGVRMVQVYFGNFQPWDSHDDIRVHADLAAQADGPIAALIDDLNARGLFQDTLLIVGSVKGDISRLGHAALAATRRHFVGAHPMAGSEKTGWEHGTESLFQRRTCFVTPLPDTDARAVETVVAFWRELGAEVVTVTPDQHDEIVAHISHLPQVIASSLCAFLSTKNPAWRHHAGGGLRDTTRIAASDPQLWRSILEQNHDEVLRALRQFEDELHGFQTALANRDYAEVVSRLERGKAYRDHFRPAP
jgi:prephenate dehydrogenase